MNVCLNAIDFAPGKMGGVETYLRELICHIPRVTSNDSFVLYINNKYQNEFAENTHFSIRSTKKYEHEDLRGLFHRIVKKFSGFDVYAHYLSKIESEVIHYPFSILSPQITDRPTVLTFWDMQHEFYPEFFSSKELECRSKIYKPSVETATRVIVSAEFTKRCLIERYGISSNKIDVIYTGYSPFFKMIEHDDKFDQLRNQYSLDRPFIYYPAATWPHKNHSRLIGSLKLLVDRYKFDGLLVLSGIAMNQHAEIVKKINELGLSGRVRILGYLPYSELPYFYNMARLMVFPSLFEGFGIPLVEAMACGCPVAASDCTSVPEIVGDTGKLFDPSSVEDIADTIWSVWREKQELLAMREKGLARVAQFSWDSTAQKTLSAYRKACD